MHYKIVVVDFEANVEYDCYREVVQSYEDSCGTLIDKDFKFMPNIANFCTK